MLSICELSLGSNYDDIMIHVLLFTPYDKVDIKDKSSETAKVKVLIKGEMGRGKFGTVYHVVGRKDGISYASKHVKYR